MKSKVLAVVLGDQPLTIEALVRVARDGAPVVLSDAARQRAASAREVVERLARSDRAIYGLTTGLGANVGMRLAGDDLAEYQRRAVMARSVGVGASLSRSTVRAIMLARVAGLSVGGSGISPPLIDGLVAMLNAQLHPQVPGKGSIGVADLGPMAHLVLPLLGLGSAEYRGEIMSGAQALRRAGLEPVSLGPKDGLALISANAASVGRGALVVADAQRVLQALDAAAALSLEAFRGNLSPLDPRVQAVRPAPGQTQSAERMRALLAGSGLWHAGAARRVQDPLSFRCIVQVHGAAQWALDGARECIEIELNGAGDSPLVLVDDDEMLSTGNFHIPALTLAFEQAGLGMAQMAAVSAQRVIKLVSPPFSELPLQLTPHGGSRSGFATLQKTLTALVAEIRHLANPACLDFLPVSEGVEDHAPMAPRVVEKTEEIVDALRYVAAIEMLHAAQAVDLRGVASLGLGARALYQAIRAEVPALDEDRILGPDVERLEALIRSGGLAEALTKVLA
jgi:histidine ammonia-lyase